MLRAKGIEVITKMLYVDSGLIKADLKRYVDEHQPDYVVCMGEMNQDDASSPLVYAEKYADYSYRSPRSKEGTTHVYTDTAFIREIVPKMQETRCAAHEGAGTSACNVAFDEALGLMPEKAYFLHLSDYLYCSDTTYEYLPRTSPTDQPRYNDLAKKYAAQVTTFLEGLAAREVSRGGR